MARRKQGKQQLAKLSDDQLMDLRFCDLDLSINDTPLEKRISLLYKELKDRGLNFRPHCWLSNDWFSPDGVPGIAIPFYLAHPRLISLQRKQLLEVEGSTHQWCMKILRHEVGHAIDTAFRLRRKQMYRKMFGKASVPYPDYYQPAPESREYVLHLDYWYSQSHPLEDFAETFAVWLKPGSRWRSRYEGWPAKSKLEYVDRLMREIADKPPKTKTRRKEEPSTKVRMTLREYYEQKKQHYQHYQ